MRFIYPRVGKSIRRLIFSALFTFEKTTISYSIQAPAAGAWLSQPLRLADRMHIQQSSLVLDLFLEAAES